MWGGGRPARGPLSSTLASFQVMRLSNRRQIRPSLLAYLSKVSLEAKGEVGGHGRLCAKSFGHTDSAEPQIPVFTNAQRASRPRAGRKRLRPLMMWSCDRQTAPGLPHLAKWHDIESEFYNSGHASGRNWSQKVATVRNPFKGRMPASVQMRQCLCSLATAGASGNLAARQYGHAHSSRLLSVQGLFW